MYMSGGWWSTRTPSKDRGDYRVEKFRTQEGGYTTSLR